MTRIAIVFSSTRDGRFADKPARWVIEHLQKRTEIQLDVIDLRDHKLDYFDQKPPAYAPRQYKTPEIARFGERIDSADAFIFLVAEYNHGYSGELKNAMDHLFVEFHRKPVAFVGWGNVGGARAIEQLRNVVVEFEMAPLRHAVHIVPPLMVEAMHSEPFDTAILDPLSPKLDALIDDLLWWSNALSTARVVYA